MVRTCKNLTLEEKISKLREWKQNPDWSLGDAAEKLGEKKGTLHGWKKNLWHRIDEKLQPGAGERKREKGAGRPHRLAPYELRVLEYYETCIADDGSISNVSLRKYCEQIPEFVRDKTEDAQKTWVQRFVVRYKDFVAARVKETREAEKAAEAENNAEAENTTEAAEATKTVVVDIVTQTAHTDKTPDAAEGKAAAGGGESTEHVLTRFSGDCDGVEGKGDSCTDEKEPDSGKSSNDEYGENNDGSSDVDVEMVGVIGVGDRSISKGGIAAAIATKSAHSANTQRFFRARYPSHLPLVVYTDPQTNYTLHVFTDDSDSLLNNTATTGNAIDYFIHRYVENKPGIVCAIGTALFAQIEMAFCARSSSKRKRMTKSSINMFDWSAYRYVLVPLSGRNHWSFLIVENAAESGQRKMYHVDSLKGVHKPDYVFAVFSWFFGIVFAGDMGDSAAPFEVSTYAYTTRPQQTNSLDCGIYLLHYIDTISTLVAKTEPPSIENDIEKWTRGGFNATKSEQYRALLHQRIHEDMGSQ